jgi:hypothetical protein
MKTIIRFFGTCIVCVCCLSLSAQQKEVPKEILGKWSCAYDDPQTGQPSKGFCTIKQEGQSVTATFEIDYGTITTTPFRPNANGKLYADMEVQGYSLSVAFAIVDNKLSCNVSADDFNVPILMQRAE